MMYINENGTLVVNKEKKPKIKETTEQLKIQLKTDALKKKYLLIIDGSRDYNENTVTYWKNYFVHNIKEIKSVSNIEYVVIKFGDGKHHKIWS